MGLSRQEYWSGLLFPSPVDNVCQYVNHELPDAQAGFRKGRGARDQTAKIISIIKQQGSPRITSTSALLIMPNPLTVWITINCGKFLKKTGIPDHLTCLLRKLYAGQEATVRTGRGTMDWFPAYLISMQSTSYEILVRWSTSWNQDCQEKYQ